MRNLIHVFFSHAGGLDYGPFPAPELNLTATILSSETVIQFGVFLREDGIVERTEQFRASLYLPSGDTAGRNIFIQGHANADVFIADNDGEGVCIQATTTTTTTTAN